MSLIKKVATAEFQLEVLDFSGVVLVDFYADWCGPCKILAPELAILSQELEENKDVKIVSVDTEASPELADNYQIRSIPNVIVFKNGNKLDEIIGLRDKEHYKRIIFEALLKS